ncbi:hypothetical protein ACQPXM_04205 [Kribbella sp. CA-253562]|uniref:hypothetical protein n=1 Tax=Kribbella sp. CA-253562 TaxID=3239942 RepID=UPI003D8EC2BB
MKEEELNEALHDVMVRSSPPPSMDPARALDQARRARKRRRVTWAAVGVATLVAGVGVGPVLVTNYLDNQSADSGAASTTQPISSVAPTTTRKSGDPWPEGQSDRTATAGPRADRSVTLMRDLSAAVPPGFSTPDLKYPDGRAMRWPQSQYASSDGERDYWEYRAIIPVQKDDRVGLLLAQSTTPDGKPATDPCKLAQKFGAGSCTVVNVDGKKVGVVTTTGRGDYDQWAAYRYDDGTVVYLAQTKKSDNPGRAPLTQPVFTTQQLAELATSEELKISS